MITSLLLGYVVVPALQAAPSSVLLRYKFEVGVKRHYQSVTAMNMVLNDGKLPPMNMSTTSEFTQTVKSIDTSGSALLETIYTASDMKVNGSADPNVKKPLNTVVTFRMNPAGKVDSIGIPAGTGLDLSSMQASGTLPLVAIQVGAKWDSAVKLPQSGDITIHNLVKHIDVTENQVLVTIEGDAVMDVSKMAALIPIPKMQISGSATMHTIWVFNATLGCLQSNRTTSTMDMTMSSTDPSLASVGPIKEKGTQTLDSHLIP